MWPYHSNLYKKLNPTFFDPIQDSVKICLIYMKYFHPKRDQSILFFSIFFKRPIHFRVGPIT